MNHQFEIYEKQNLKILDYKELEDKTIRIIVEFDTSEIASKSAKKYSEFRDFVKVKVIDNIIEIIYPPDWNIPEENDNELDIIDSWIEEGEV